MWRWGLQNHNAPAARAHPFLMLLVGAVICVVGLPLCGCITAVDPSGTDGGDNTDAQTPEWLITARALGIWEEIERVAATMPDYLLEAPGADGEGPFEVELLADIPFRTTPQRTLTLNIHRPKVTDGKLRRAIVLYMGGGSLDDFDFEVFEAWGDFLASRGFVTFNARQRLRTEPDVDQYDVVSDCLAAVRFVIAEGQRYGADPLRVGVLGRSSGGQLALLVGTYPNPDEFRQPEEPEVPIRVGAIVDIHGPVDYARLVRGDDFTLTPTEEFIQQMGGTPESIPEVYAFSSPLTHVRPGLPPTLICHGQLDLTIPFSQSVTLADALEAQGNTVVREFYSDTGHVLGWGFIHNEGFGRAMTRILRFFEEHL